MDLVGGDIELRSKRELVEEFILENLPFIDNADNIPDEFEKYWQEQKILAVTNSAKTNTWIKNNVKPL